MQSWIDIEEDVSKEYEYMPYSKALRWVALVRC
jgi:hypothetical protein